MSEYSPEAERLARVQRASADEPVSQWQVDAAQRAIDAGWQPPPDPAEPDPVEPVMLLAEGGA